MARAISVGGDRFIKHALGIYNATRAFSRPLKGTCVGCVRFPAVETAGYYQTSR